MTTRIKRKIIVWAGALALAAASAQVWADVYNVTNAQELQTALTLAAGNGAPTNTIYLWPAYYIGNFNYNSTTPSSLIVSAGPGLTNGQVALDGGGTWRDMNLASTGMGSITVNGLTFLRNCGSSTIGALRVAAGANANILVENCQFLSPTNSSGMGVEIGSALNAAVANCVVAGLGGQGSGISAVGVTGTFSLQGCAVSTNTCSENTYSESGYGGLAGGGVFIDIAGAASLAGNTFAGNFANSYGGAVCCMGPLALTNNTFTANTCNSYYEAGGAVLCLGPATLAGNTFTANSILQGNGGGGAAYLLSSAVVIGNTFANNWVNGGATGGGLCVLGSPATVIGNTFFENWTRSGSGGGLYCNASSSLLVGNTFAGNGAGGGYGAGVFIYGYGAAISTVSSNVFLANASGLGGEDFMTTAKQRPSRTTLS